MCNKPLFSNSGFLLHVNTIMLLKIGVILVYLQHC